FEPRRPDFFWRNFLSTWRHRIGFNERNRNVWGWSAPQIEDEQLAIEQHRHHYVSGFIQRMKDQDWRAIRMLDLNRTVRRGVLIISQTKAERSARDGWEEKGSSQLRAQRDGDWSAWRQDLSGYVLRHSQRRTTKQDHKSSHSPPSLPAFASFWQRAQNSCRFSITSSS